MSRRYGSFAFVLLAVFALALVVSAPRPGRAQFSGYRLYHLGFRKNDLGYNSTLYLNNTASVTANVVISLYAAEGNPSYAETRTVAANGLLIVPAASLASVPAGFYNVIVSSDQPLESVVRSQGSSGPDSLFIDRGSTEVTTTHVFGPFLKGSLNTGVVLFPPIAPANIVAAFRNSDGTLAYSQNYVGNRSVGQPVCTAEGAETAEMSVF